MAVDMCGSLHRLLGNTDYWRSYLMGRFVMFYGFPLEMVLRDGKLIVAYKNLETVPAENEDVDQIYTLDASHNNIRNIMFLENFKCLTSLILDHNMIDANVVFPKMQTVTLLWLNYNDIRNLDPFIRLLHSSFPSLKQLSLMGNEIVPPCREDTFYYYIQYRMYVLSWFRNLEHLDDRSVCQYELEEAQRIYKRPLLDRIQSTSLPKMFQTSLNVLKQLISWDTTTSNETERYHSSVV